jgi:molybdopterin-guanine dinucleotide biosynthesis protein A
MKIAVAILAGGKGSRIGGGKPLKLLRGRPLVEHAEALARQWSSLVAVAVRDPAQLGKARLPFIVDEPGIDGPLAGLVAALRFASELGCEAVLTIPADMPFLPADLSERLARALGAKPAALAHSAGHLHPVCGLWRVGVLDAVPDYLASGRRSLRGLAESVGFQSVDWPDDPVDPFFNINCVQDLDVAQDLLGR